MTRVGGRRRRRGDAEGWRLESNERRKGSSEEEEKEGVGIVGGGWSAMRKSVDDG
jgi:hypothetical protein